MKKLLLILATILIAISARAQQQDRTEFFKEGDTVTICRVNGNTRTYYLTVNDRGEITSHNEPNDDALWVISHGTYQTFNWGDQDQYSFQHLKTDKYLHANITRRGNNYTTKLELGDNASLFIENSPEGENNKYTNVSEMHYNYPNGNSTVTFHLTVDNKGTWSLKQNSATSLQIEKWTKHSEASFNAYFSPENHDFKLAKTEEDAQAQTKQVRFVFDLVDESYLTCNNNSTTKQLLHTSNSEYDLNVLKGKGIIPSFSWKSSKTRTSTLTRSNYTATAEQSDRDMMELSGTGDGGQYKISEDDLAWEVRITPKGPSPMGLKKTNYNNVESYTNYVDYLEAKWSYGNKDYSATARIVRKSYRVEDLPIFEFTSNPSTFTFPGQDNNETSESELQQTFKIHGYHQHGTAYYDVDGNLVEKNITYGPGGKPVKMPLKNHYQDGEVILNYTLKFQYKNGENWVDEESYNADWLTHTVNEGDTTITISTTQNDGTYRQARLVGTINVYKNQSGTEEHQHSGEFIIPINQRSKSGEATTFQPYDGASYKDTDKDNDLLNGRQQVHTAERIIYYTRNQDIQLRLAESNFFGYMRWYDFNTGHDPQWNSPDTRTTWATQPRGANGQAFKAINTDDNSQGLYGVNGEALNQSNENNPSPVLRGWNYNYNRENPQVNAASGYYTIACDVSAYTDYEIEKDAGNNNRVTAITEPTLSYRQLFHLRPAEEIATKINTLSHLSDEEGESSFLEEYKYMASVGVDVHLATKYRYKTYTGSHESELCYFFFGTGNTLYRIGKDVQAKWYRVENKQEVQITNPTYAAYDYLQVDSDIEKTDTIILKVPSTDLEKYGLQRDLLLARFIIQYVNKNSAGPVASTIITDHEIDDHFIRLETIDFNFKEANPSVVEVVNNGKTIRQLDYHLPWEQSSYGYYYPKSNDYSKLGELSPNRSGQAIPYYGEYFLVNKLEKDWANATAHGGANDFALYVDGTTEPGVVATISTKAIICAGQTLYCSAWFCNPCPTSFDYNSPRNPIFRCNVQGRTKKQNPVGNDTWNDWEDVSVFFVGQLDKGSGWQQIVFPVESDKSYDETRVSIYNFATGGSGNDFMVDDICLFASQLPLASYQAQTNCASDANTESSTAVILRIDYTEFQGRRDQYMYYQIYNNTKDAVINLEQTTTTNSAYYHDNSGDVLQKAYGSVLIPRFDMVPVAGGSDGSGELIKIYASVQSFKDALVDEIQQRKNAAGDSDNYEKSAHGKAYIQTTTNDGQTKWLLYVMHIVPNAGEEDETLSNKEENKYLFEHYNYTLRMANVPEELNAAECNMQTTLHATQSTEFDLYNGCGQEPLVKGFLPNVEGLCPNNLYTLHSMIENVLAPTTGTTLQQVRGSVMADWLVGFEFDDIYADTKSHDPEKVAAAKAAFAAKYGYSRAAIKTALLYDLRRPSTEYDKNCNINATSFEELDINCFQEEVNYYIIKDLCERGLLQLGKRTSTFYLGSEETVRYWVYPIDGTAKGTIGGTEIELHDCTEPIWVMVSSEEASAKLNISPLTEAQKTDLLDEYPTIMQDIPTVRVRKSELDKKSITVPVTESTVVGKNQGSELVINLDNVKFYNIETGKPIDRPANLEIGQKYTVCTTFDLSADICPEPGTCKNLICFNILVLPDAVIWDPAAGSHNGWGLDENWKGWNDKNNNGVIENEEKMSVGFVPIAGSNVIIPTLPDVTLYPYVHDHNHYPMDVNAHPSTCNNIYFAPGALIHNQHLLQYNKAFVDMTIPKGNWYMMSAPLQKMYSGDMYVPHEGNWETGSSLEIDAPFATGAFQGTRSGTAAYAFWASYYNQSVKTWYGDGNYIESTSSSFQQSNGLNQPLEVGSGFALWGEGKEEQKGEDIVIRLPKQETTYSSSSGTSVQVPREGKSHKLAFTATQEGETITPMTITLTNKEASKYFIFGNPTMAYINMHDFLHDNEGVLNHTFYRIESGAWNAEIEHTMSENRFLAPMSAVMLETKDKNKQEKLTVQLSPLHLTLTDQQDPFSPENPEIKPSAPRAKEEDKSSTSEIMTIYTFTDDAYARTVLATNPAANDYYQIGEDAIFVSSGVESNSYLVTPLNMYTVAEQVPMMADVRQGISNIPLSILAAEGYHTQHMQVAFYLSSNWSRTCYFCDSKTGQKIRIMDGLVISVEMPQNHEQRYFIEGPDTYLGSGNTNGNGTSTSAHNTNATSASIHAYSQDKGQLTVTANQPIRELKVYSITGQLLSHPISTTSCQLSTVNCQIPSGVCIVEATLYNGTTLHTQAVVK